MVYLGVFGYILGVFG